MDWLSWHMFSRCAILVAAVWTIVQAYRITTTRLRYRRLANKHGCKPIRKRANRYPFGIDLLIKGMRDNKEHRILEASLRHFTDPRTNTFKFDFFNEHLITTVEAENVKTLLAINFKSWGLADLRKGLIPLLGEGIFSTDGQAWQHSRDMLRPNFVRSQVADMSLLDEHIDQLILQIPGDQSTIDLQPLFLQFTLDVATAFLFGESTRCLSSSGGTQSSKDFAAAFERCVKAVDLDFGIFGFLDQFLPWSQSKRDYKTVHAFADRIIEAALSSPKPTTSTSDHSRYILLHELLTHTRSKPRIRAELLNVLLAGRDTTASVLSNVFFQLARRPDVLSTLRAEISTLSGQRPTYTELKSMPYLHAVLNESLRLYPVVPMNGRTALEDTTLPLGGGEDGRSPVFVPKGHVVTWNLFAMHRNSEVYGADALDFRPGRWIDEKLRPGWNYLPFNGGPRICIGQNFALTEAAYTTVCLVQAFSRLESRDLEPWREKMALTCTGFGGCKVVMQR